MVIRFVRLLAIVLAVAVFAVACRIDTATDTTSDADTPIGESSDAPAVPASATPEPTPDPTALPDPTPQPTTEPTPQPTAPPQPSATATPIPDTASPETASPDTASPDTAEIAEGDELLPLDEDVVVGELDNGMRYFVRRNTRPGGQAQLRMTVDVGSIHESEELGGIAHFAEHMMFNGTERFPRNELIPVLESFGAAFGADVNAYTSFEETVYLLTVPARGESLQLGIDVLREWAGRATLTDQAVIGERGVVREELRLATESASSRAGNLMFDALLAESAFQDKLPIGGIGPVESMRSEDIRDFYDAWYRPERMAIVAVGDFDPADIERRIVAAFSDFEARADPIDLDLDLGAGPLPEPLFDVLIDDEIGRPDLEVLWRFDFEPVRTRNGIRRALLGEITREMLDKRFFEIVQGSSSALVEHTVEIGAFTSNFQLLSVAGSARADQMDVMFGEIMAELERVRQHGFDDDEFARAVDKFRAGIDQEYVERATRQDDDIAHALTEVALNRGMLFSADVKFENFTAALDSLTPADAQSLVGEIITGDPYVLLTGPTAREDVLPEPEELAEVYEAAKGAAVEPRGQAAAVPDQLMVRPEAAAIISTETIDAIGATVVTFENGARMGFRRTDIVDNVLSFSAVSEGGHFATDGPETPLLGQISGSIMQSGFESVDAVTLGRFVSGSSVQLTGAIGRSYERLGGGTATTDLETFMQLVHLQMTEPVLEPAQVRQFEQLYRPLAIDPLSRPDLAASLEMWTLRYGTSPWYRLLPTVEDLDGLDPTLLRDAWAERFSNASDFLFLFAGDADEEELFDLGARYLGTLPGTGERETVTPRDPGIPQENLLSVVEAGISNQGIVTWNWESPYPYTLRDGIIADLLLIIVNARLRDRIREELGASYSPSAQATRLSQPEPWIDTTLQVAGDPERLEELSLVVDEELAKIRTGEFDIGYLERAVDLQVEEYRFFSNGNWLDELEIQLFNPERGDDEIWQREAIATAVTLTDIVAAAAVVFPEDRSIEVRLVPAQR